MRPWTLQEAIELVQTLEPKVSSYHLALTGSVLYSGSSDKDLDIICYPRKTTKLSAPGAILRCLNLKQIKRCNHEDYDDKIVYETEYQDGRRIDVFFMK